MYQLTSLVAATDLSRRSTAVLPRSAQLARAHGAKLVLVHVREPGAARMKRFRLNPMGRDVEREIEDIVARFPDLDIETIVETGKPAEVITRVAKARGADLVVLGLHLKRRMLDTLRLTNLERIVQDVACPVLIAHTPSAAPYRRVLGAITFAPASAKALRVAAHLAPEAELHAIHALQVPLVAAMPGETLLATPQMTEAELLRRGFLDHEDLPARLTLPEIVAGGVHEVLQFRINELAPDLVVIGSHSGRSATRLGNYARDLMRAPPTDMLIAKPE